MTRYARAKGSKASNEKIANDATPWHIMKEQLVENLSKQQERSVKNKSAKELLQGKQDVFYCDNGNVNNDWAEFEENCITQNNTSIIKKDKKKQKAPVHLNIPQKNQNISSNEAKVFNQDEKHIDNIKVKKKSSLKRNINEVNNSTTEVKVKKHKKEKNQFENINNSEKDHSSNEVIIQTNEIDVKHSKLNEKRKRVKHNDEKSIKLLKKNDTLQIDENEKNASNNIHNLIEGKECMLSKRQKRNMRKQKKNLNENVSENCENTTKQEKRFKKKNNVSIQNNDSNSNNNNTEVQNTQNNGENENEGNSHVTKKFNKTFGNKSDNFKNVLNKFGKNKFENNRNNKRKPPKIRDDKEHKRRKADLGPTKMIINGVEIEIVKFDGFPVKKEDAERLRDLKQKMIMKGIPKKEIDAAMKLERRKAEKALARIRKCVCFHCRKAGHNLSDCPELGSEQAGTGICFKCGSTEHTHFECKVAKPTEFRYATCFICREQGHIAKQCPDNPKGVYPQGGACKICGDVTHLKKDCPDLIKEKEENTITVNTIANGNLESLGENMKIVHEKDDKKSKKVVKF